MNPEKRPQEMTGQSGHNLNIRKEILGEGSSSTKMQFVQSGAAATVYAPMPLRWFRGPDVVSVAPPSTENLMSTQFAPMAPPLAPAPLAAMAPVVAPMAPASLPASSRGKRGWSTHLASPLATMAPALAPMEPAPRAAMSPVVVPPMAPPPLAATAPAVAPSVALQKQYEEQCLFLIKLLQSCAAALAEGETELVNKGLEKVSSLASVDGEPIQRLASSLAYALAVRLVQPWQGVCHALELSQAIPEQGASMARQNFAMMCPFLRLAAVASNFAVVEAMQAEKNNVVHVVHLGGTNPEQWLHLLRLFAPLRVGARHHLRLTVVNEQEDEFRSAAAALLAPEAERLRVRFHFHQVKSSIDELLSVESLGIKSGEALAVVSTLQLHRLLSYEFADVDSHDRKGKGKAKTTAAPPHTQQHTMTRADALLREFRELSPRLMVVIEQEADHNGAEFTSRFWNAFNYYGALFDTLEESAPRECPRRFCVERWVLREEIRDIVACEGALRRERHEMVERWAVRMHAAGFVPVAMSHHALVQTAELARNLPGGAMVSKENDGCFFLRRHAFPIFSITTWCAHQEEQPVKRRSTSKLIYGSRRASEPVDNVIDLME